jgi:hypothetical protein
VSQVTIDRELSTREVAEVLGGGLGAVRASHVPLICTTSKEAVEAVGRDLFSPFVTSVPLHYAVYLMACLAVPCRCQQDAVLEPKYM